MDQSNTLVTADFSWLQKAGNLPHEWEDAVFPQLPHTWDGENIRIAISDGASSAMLSREWAKLLTEVACQREVYVHDIQTICKSASDKWNQWLKGYLRWREEEKRPIKWYEEPGLRAGAYATLLNLELKLTGSIGTWQAIAIGDSCLFQIRRESIITAFPIEDSKLFGNSPALIGSTLSSNQNLDEIIYQERGNIELNDEFYIMTDALAQWFLAIYEAGGKPWETLKYSSGKNEEQEFEKFIVDLREHQELHNDDVTLVRISIEGSSSPSNGSSNSS